jgi:hypothetical protein
MGAHFNKTLMPFNFPFRRALIGKPTVEAPSVPTVKAEGTTPERKLYVKDTDEALELSDKV